MNLLSKAKISRVLNAWDGLSRVKLDEQSSFPTTFWTSFGGYG